MINLQSTKKPNKFLIVLLCACCGFAQQVTTGKITPVATGGLHKIMLPADIRSYSNEDLSDFRIYDSRNREVPYFLIHGNSAVMLKEFEEYALVKTNSVPKKFTSYTIDTGSENKLNGLSLTIANADVVKKYSLSGSHDQKQWYGIINDGALSGLNDPENTSVVKDISFPLSSYRYLKIIFDDVLTLPINLMGAGIRKHEIRENNLQGIVPKKMVITLLKEQKMTLINVVFEHKQIINRINFDIAFPKFFKRPVSIYMDATRRVKRKNITYNELVTSFELSSQAKTSFDVPQLFLDELEIEITNHDSQPLDIASIHFSQLPAYAIADLSPNETYTVRTGNSALAAPQYDIADLNTTELGKYPETAVTDIGHDPVMVEKLRKKSVWQQPWFLWLCIAITALVVLFFTVRLVRDMK